MVMVRDGLWVDIGLSQQALNLSLLQPPAADANFGAQACFVGRVRGYNAKRQVTKLCYELHAPLAKQVLQAIAHEAAERWSARAAIAIHHTAGTLLPGEVSVIVDVYTPHRAEAFAMCHYIIEQLKIRAPIWKKEIYVDGETEWLDGHSLCQHHHQHQHELKN